MRYCEFQWRLGDAAALRTAAALALVLLAGCTLPDQQLSLPERLTTADAPARQGARQGVPLSDRADPAAREPLVWHGSGQFSQVPPASAEQSAARRATAAADGVTLNFSGASVAEVARVVLGDVLGVNYTVADGLGGSITIKTSQPIPRNEVLSTLETLLKSEGAAIVVDNGLYRVVQASTAGAGRIRRSSQDRAGVASDVIALRHVVPDDMQRLLSSLIPAGAKLAVDPNRNVLIVSGPASDIAAIKDMVEVFDVDWMKGTSFGLYPLESGDPEAVARELDTIFANDRSSPIKGMVRFIPNRRLKSILIVSSRPEYLRRAEGWLKRIDIVGQETDKQVHVYRVQNRSASELAALLQRVYGQQQSPRGGAGRAGLPPGAAVGTLASDAGLVPGGGVADSGPRPLPQLEVAPTPAPGIATLSQPALAGTAPSAAPVAGELPAGVQPGAVGGQAGVPTGSRNGVPDDRTSGIEVLADEANNALIVTATHREFKRVRQILSRIDVAPNQVLLEATIAEVTLNDRLQFGLRWFFEGGSNRFNLTDSALGVVAGRVPGFSYFLNTPNVQVALSALSDVTDVNIVSSPSLMVIENKKAQLQIGDEVPIATQSAVAVTAPGSPIVNTISFRNTGVILNIVPQVSDNGTIMLDIEQEVSDVVPTTSSTIDSPTIQQRRIKTKVAVGNGQAIVLAGFIQDRAQRGRQQVPLFGNIPVVGNLFKDKNDQIRRTELLIAITPHIVSDQGQIRSIAAEFRDRMNFRTRPQRTAPPDTREQIERTLVR